MAKDRIYLNSTIGILRREYFPPQESRCVSSIAKKNMDGPLCVRWSVKRGSPFGCEAWMESTALRPRGRHQVRFFPKKSNNDS